MFTDMLKEIDEEVARCENLITLNPHAEDSWIDRIQGILWVRNLIYKSLHHQPHDVEEYYKE